jgi:hypothetical protein
MVSTSTLVSTVPDTHTHAEGVLTMMKLTSADDSADDGGEGDDGGDDDGPSRNKQQQIVNKTLQINQHKINTTRRQTHHMHASSDHGHMTPVSLRPSPQ